MLGLNGGIRLWYIEGINNMRYGKYRLFCEVESLDMDPYNGDGYIFMSKLDNPSSCGTGYPSGYCRT